MAKITVSIVTYNGVNVIGPCLQSLQNQTLEDFELIVVDNASQDATIEEIKQRMPQVNLIALTENVGFGAGHNISITRAQAPWILLLNQDVVLEADCLERMYAATLQGTVAAIGPCLLRSREDAARTVDTAGLEKTWYYKVSDRGSNKPLRDIWQRSGHVWGVSGACMLLRKTALQQIAYVRRDRPDAPEYFDETFFMYKEDVDLCARLHRQNWKFWYEASAIGYHKRTGRAPKTTRELREHRRLMPSYVKQYSYRNQAFVLIKHAPLLLLPLILPYELLKFVYVLFFEPRSLRFLPHLISKLPLMLKRRYGASA